MLFSHTYDTVKEKRCRFVDPQRSHINIQTWRMAVNTTSQNGGNEAPKSVSDSSNQVQKWFKQRLYFLYI